MARKRGEKRPECPLFDQTKGELEVETGHYLPAYFANVRCLAKISGFCMTLTYLAALVLIAASLSILMAGAFLVQQRTGNSGWVDTIWTFSLGLVGAASALWPIAGAAPNARQWLVAALVAIWSLRLGIHIAIRTSGIADDPRYAAFAKQWGIDAPRRMFIFLQNQALGSIPLAFAIFVAARFPDHALRWQDVLGALILFAGIAG